MGKFFQKLTRLPPWAQMLFIMAFGVSVYSLLQSGIRHYIRRPAVLITLLCVAAAAALFYGVFTLIRRRRARSFGRQLQEGPGRGEIAEQERVYRRKFNDALAKLRGLPKPIDVYDLPWYVMLGEPGGGKTYSLLNSGLPFPLGKEEVAGFGGTRNYNWWFTDEAVILDTAGRIAFQEEGTTDKQEWEIFLGLLRKYRPRGPINGVVIGLPADKLISDTADERESKAMVLRERTRQMQHALGVRFPVYLLITKTDKIPGFTQFFNDFDLMQRNQMVGWSRPGDEYQQLYDPDEFGTHFDAVWSSLHAWGLKFLARRADVHELGWIATFPAAFRALRDPLQNYVNVLFGKSRLVEPPFLRGCFFTSAVQEGAPLAAVLAQYLRRSGDAELEKLDRLEDVFPDSHAFFIHDFFRKKVFPEAGLVTRSAREVVLNQRLRRVALAGGATLAVLMMAALIWGTLTYNTLVATPTEHARFAWQLTDPAAAEAYDWPGEIKKKSYSGGALELCEQLSNDVKAFGSLSARFWAWMMLSSARSPQAHLAQTHARLFARQCLEKRVLGEVCPRIRAGLASEDGGRAETRDAKASTSPERYVRSLSELIRWYVGVPGAGTADSLQALAAVLDTSESESRRLVEQFVRFKDSESGDPFEVIDRNETVVSGAIQQGLASLTEYWRGNRNTDPQLRWWGELYQRCDAAMQGYGDALTRNAAALHAAHSADGVNAALESWRGTLVPGERSAAREWPAAFVPRLAWIESRLAETAGKAGSYDNELSAWEARWKRQFDGLMSAEVLGEEKSFAEETTRARRQKVMGWVKAQRDALDAERARSAEEAARLAGSFRLLVSSAATDTASRPGPAAGSGMTLSPEARQVRERLEQVNLAARAETAAENLLIWAKQLDDEMQPVNAVVPANLPEGWRPAQLGQLLSAAVELRRRSRVSDLVARLDEQLAEAAKSELGLARLYPGFQTPVKDHPFQIEGEVKEKVRTREEPKDDGRPKERGTRLPPGQRADRTAASSRPASPTPATAGRGEASAADVDRSIDARPTRAYRFQQREFLADLTNDRNKLYDRLSDAEVIDQLLDPAIGAQVQKKLAEDAWQKYLERYFVDWRRKYQEVPVAQFDKYEEKLRFDRPGWDWWYQLMLEQLKDVEVAIGRRLGDLADNVTWCEVALDNGERRARVALDEDAQAILDMRERQFPLLGKAFQDRCRTGGLTGGKLEEKLISAWRSGFLGGLHEVDRFLKAPNPPGEILPRNFDFQMFEKLAGDWGLERDAQYLPKLGRVAHDAEERLSAEIDARLEKLLADARLSRDDFPFAPGLFPPSGGRITLAGRYVESAAFLKFLGDVRQFNERYGKVGGSGAKARTEFMRRCLDWERFLYGDAKDGPRAGRPAAQRLTVQYRKREQQITQNFYPKAALEAPLLNAAGDPMSKQEFDLRVAADPAPDQLGEQKLFWQLAPPASAEPPKGIPELRVFFPAYDWSNEPGRQNERYADLEVLKGGKDPLGLMAAVIELGKPLAGVGPRPAPAGGGDGSPGGANSEARLLDLPTTLPAQAGGRLPDKPQNLQLQLVITFDRRLPELIGWFTATKGAAPADAARKPEPATAREER